ncbi:MAG: hypothetical protein KGM44_00575 [bacterium]|nr:hypothetical protein [bacterium]
MRLYAGVDGGQTTTQAVIGDERGAILGRGQGGPANHVDEPGAEDRLRAAVAGALTQALRGAALPSATLFEGVHVALTGEVDALRSGAVREVVRSARLTVAHDAPAAWMGAFAGEPGVVVVAGTGSVAYGRNADGDEARVGGWGYLFGDRGSAFWLAAEALRRGLEVDDRGRATPLAGAALEHFRVRRLAEVPAAFYRRRLTRERLASFAPVVNEMARGGDVGAGALVTEAAHALTELAFVALERLSIRRGEVAVVGGLGGDPLIRAGMARELEVRGARLREPAADPVMGAFWLALGSSVGADGG